MVEFTSRKLEINANNNQVQRIVTTMYYTILRDFIANANEQKVLDELYKFYTESDLTLISKQQLRVYQELEKLSLNMSPFDIKKD